jgi:hypothetical protein
MEINGTGGKYPVRDIWSNEDGGRIFEDQRRYGARMQIKSMQESASRLRVTLESNVQVAGGEFARRQSSFVENYGADALSQLAGGGRDAFLEGRSAENVKQLLTDLSALQSAGAAEKQAVDLRDFISKKYEQAIEGVKVGAEFWANSYDARFLADDEGRLAAYNRMQAAAERLSALGRDSRGSTAAFMAGRIAEIASLKEQLGPPSALYSVNSNGAIKIDFSALEKIGPGEAATSELARLIGVLAERNGLGQLRDGLIGIVNGQNRRLAERTGG